MKENRCPNCGAPLGAEFNQKTTKCPYCNSVFVNKEFAQEEKNISQNEEIKPDITFDLNKDKDKNEKPHPKFNFFIFILLLCVFWPLAIIYAIISK